ncbi:hypothetical protein [Streptococcus danieliae]|uniref:Uncharacterized protein n=1 Tax=Streptococcus danieliae TaxID=747656 RepID=A0A7Z0S4W2_9STRE|nr:hypothetical protein [Streptococcus danieliae]MBF0699443.1 hypothetical protein [Streptococcus danieliae]NYS96619.1 hypothetical protein [Streptococcus danieliae]
MKLVKIGNDWVAPQKVMWIDQIVVDEKLKTRVCMPDNYTTTVDLALDEVAAIINGGLE